MRSQVCWMAMGPFRYAHLVDCERLGGSLRGLPGGDDGLDFRKGWSLAQPLYPGTQNLTGALRIGFNSPIRYVAYPTDQIQFQRDVLGKIAESYALNATTNKELYSGLG